MEVPQGTGLETGSYDEFFADNYDTLRRWALQITTRDHDLAEDLVHDVYVRFRQRSLSPDGLDSAHGYLYTALRNAYVSVVLRRGKIRSKQVSLLDYELAENALLAIDPRHEIRVHDELRAICSFVCSRKSSSLSASILILRFFHGYFSAEVTKLVKRSPNAVEARIYKVRREIEEAFETPETTGEHPRNSVRRNTAVMNRLKTRNDLLSELRALIFEAKDGECASFDHYRRLYTCQYETLTRGHLSHLVSCEHCLEMVNELLRLPPLASRHPLDTLGPQASFELVPVRQNDRAFSAAS